MKSQNSLEDLRAVLFETIEKVSNGSLDVEKAKTVNELAKTINDQAKIHIHAAEVFRGVDSNGLFNKNSGKAIEQNAQD